jgi:hypothetical protein
VFSVGIRLDQNLVCELLLPSGTYVQSFRSIAPAVTKRAVLMDDDDGRHVIHCIGEPKSGFFTGQQSTRPFGSLDEPNMHVFVKELCYPAC